MSDRKPTYLKAVGILRRSGCWLATDRKVGGMLLSVVFPTASERTPDRKTSASGMKRLDSLKYVAAVSHKKRPTRMSVIELIVQRDRIWASSTRAGVTTQWY